MKVLELIKKVLFTHRVLLCAAVILVLKDTFPPGF